MNRDELTHAAGKHGLDLVGYTTSERVEARSEAEQKPSDISEFLPGFIAIGKRIPVGVMGAADGEPKPLAIALVHRGLEEGAAALAYELESRDQLAVVVPSLAMDFRATTELSLTPAGQGSPLIRAGAVEAGLGTAGLNRMVLTSGFGPRVLFGALMTSLEMSPDDPLENDLCPGLEACGRCAAICPGRAIPTEGGAGATLAQSRRLDEAACVEHSQPYGASTFMSHTRRLFQEPDAGQANRLIDGGRTALLWYHMTFLRQGAFSGCTRCLQVCPVGADFEKLQKSPFRQADLPPDFKPHVREDNVTVDWLGGDDSTKEQC